MDRFFDLMGWVRNKGDWMKKRKCVLCAFCHMQYDRETGWGLATKKFIELRRGK